MDVPGSFRDVDKSSWTPCINFKYQDGGNPENYYATFYEFINRHCQSCTVAITPGDREGNSNYIGSPTDNVKTPNRSFGAGFVDENGNEITF